MIVLRYENRNAAIRNGGPFIDPLLLIVYLLLLVIGLVAVYSATIAHAFHTGDPFALLRKNIVHILFAVSTMLIVSRISIRFWERITPLVLIASVVFLALVLIPSIGAEFNGSKRWIQLGDWNFQPSEFAELGFLIFAADYLASRRNRMNSLIHDILPIVGIFLMFAFLLMLEPDFGSTMVLGSVLFGLLFLNGLRWSHTALLVTVAVISIIALIVLEPYRMARWLSFTNPWADPYDSGFQLVQSLIAFGRGEWFGVGLGNSIQKLFYLPYAGSDFLLAVIAEELGFFGILMVISLFVVLIWRVFQVAWSAAAKGDYFAMNVAQAIALLIAVSAVINMGVNMGALPTKGLTLPFMSEGGTSLIVYSAAIGIVLSIEQSSRQGEES